MTETAGRWYRRALDSWTDAVRRLAVVVVALGVALTAAAFAYTVETLTINMSSTDMISSDVPFRRNDLAFNRAFPDFVDNMVVVIDGATPERAEDAAARVAGRLREMAARFRNVHTPGSGAFFDRHGLLFLDVDELSRLADRMAEAQPILAILAEDPSLRGIAEVLEVALEEGNLDENAELAEWLERMAEVAEAQRVGQPLNLSWQRLLAGDELPVDARRFVVVQPVLDYGSRSPGGAALGAIRRLATELGIDRAHGLRLRVTGSAALEQEELDSVEQSGARAALLALILVSVLLVAGLRSASLIFANVITLLMGLVWTAAFAALAIGQLNLISVAFAVLFIGLAVDFGIHMSLRYRQECAADADRAAALRRTVSGVGPALGLGAVSVAAGFYAFLPTDYRGLAELGLISGTSMFIAFAAHLTVLPALLSLLPRPNPGPALTSTPPIHVRFMLRHGRAILGVALVIGLAAAATTPFARFDFDPIHLKSPESESVATFLELAGDPDSSPYTIDVLADGLDAAQLLVAQLEALPEVERALTLQSFVPDNQDEKIRLIDAMALFLAPVVSFPTPIPAPGERERRTAFDRLSARLGVAAAGEGRLGLAAAALQGALDRLGHEAPPAATVLEELERRLTVNLPLMHERLRAALSAQPITLAGLPPELRRRWSTDDGRARIEVQPKGGIADNRELSRFANAVQAVVPTATGSPVIITEAGKVVVNAFALASIIALVLVTAILFAVLRRLRDVGLVMVPLFLVAVLTTAATVVLGLPFNFANIIVIPLLLGLGVSNGIHLVLRRREEGEGLRMFVSSTPRAVLFSALTTLAAFGSLALSGHRGMASLGQLNIIAVSFILLAMLVVLPPLMTEFDRANRTGQARS